MSQFVHKYLSFYLPVLCLVIGYPLIFLSVATTWQLILASLLSVGVIVYLSIQLQGWSQQTLLLQKTLEAFQQDMSTIVQQPATVVKPRYDSVLSQQDELYGIAHRISLLQSALTHILQDVGKHQSSLHESNDQVSTILGVMAEGVMALNHEQLIVLANPSACKLLDANQLLNRRIWEVVRHSQIHQLVESAMLSGTLQTLEFVVPRTQKTLEITVSQLPGKPARGCVVVLHDITELRQLEKLRSEFVSNVSHELKTPLSVINACAETLLDGALEDDKMKHVFVKRIYDQALRLHQLIVELLALARLESTVTTRMEFEPVAIQPLLQQCFQDHVEIAKTEEIEFQLFVPEEELAVLGIRTGLQTILDNLIANALKYTDSGGRVTVRCSADLEIVQIDVEDTGVGIAKEYQQRVFERFFRIDKARSREQGGTGLGLAIVKEWCESLGGKVSLSSQLGHGSTFSIELPRVQPAPSVIESTQSSVIDQ